MAGVQRPRFLFGPSGGATLAFPMASSSTLRLASATPSRIRGIAQPLALLHQEGVYIDDRTPGAMDELDLVISVNASRMGDALAAQELLWDAIGTAKGHLWIVDDDTINVVVTSSAPVAGVGQVITYTAPAATFFAINDYLFLPKAGGGSQPEVVVVTAKTDGTPSFTCTCVYPHSTAQTVYRVAIVYANAVCTGVTFAAAVPLGKGSMSLKFRTSDRPLTGTTLPT